MITVSHNDIIFIFKKEKVSEIYFNPFMKKNACNEYKDFCYLAALAWPFLFNILCW